MDEQPQSPWGQSPEGGMNQRQFKNDFGEIVRQGFRAGLNNFVMLIGLTLLPTVLVFAFLAIIILAAEIGDSEFAVVFYALGIMLIFALTYFALWTQVSVIAGMLTAIREDRTVGFKEALRLGRVHIWPYVLVALLSGLLILLGLVALIIPGLILMVLLYMAPYVVVDKQTGVIEALKGSRELMRGNAGTLVGLIIIFVLLGMVGGIIPFLPLLIAPFQAGVFAYAYLAFTSSE